jgi:CelD/BcsL family acetyltransferase involved in cellulose biosynthesis
MATRRFLHLRSTAELRAIAGAWDDLWSRSEVTTPMARAEFVAHWADHFAPQGSFHAIAVAEGDRLIAALPLVGRRVKRVLRTLALPTNPWASSGDLLIDESVDPVEASVALLSGFPRLAKPTLWLERVAVEEPRWLAFQRAARLAGFESTRQDSYVTAQIILESSFAEFEARLDPDHRRNCRSKANAIERAGGARLDVHTDGTPEEIDALVRRGFEIEDRSWKNASGTSVLKTPGMLEFYQREARIAAKLGHLNLLFFEHQGQPIAFAYNLFAKGTHYGVKIGCDANFKQLAPGHQLLRANLQRLHNDRSNLFLDFWGPALPWTENWTDCTYAVGRLTLTPRVSVNRAVVGAYERISPWLKAK